MRGLNAGGRSGTLKGFNAVPNLKYIGSHAVCVQPRSGLCPRGQQHNRRLHRRIFELNPFRIPEDSVQVNPRKSRRDAILCGCPVRIKSPLNDVKETG